MFSFRKARRIAFHTVPWAGVDADKIDLSATSVESAKSRLTEFLSCWLHLEPNDNISLVGSGRSAIALGLSALSKLDPSRSVVVVPSYTCQAVLNAVLTAGLTPKFIDTTDSLVSSAEQYFGAASSDVLCVILVNLCGKRLPPMERQQLIVAMRARRIFTIEDNCQDFSPILQSPRADMECYSLGFSKTLRATAGGVLVARQAVREVTSLFAEYLQQPVGDAVKRLKYYQTAFDHFQNGLDEELSSSFQRSRSEFGKVRMDDVDILLANASIQTLAGNMQAVSNHSREILKTIAKFPNVYEHQGAEQNCFTRLPVILPDEDVAAQFWSHMNAQGIDLEGMYSPLHVGFNSDLVLPKAEWLAKLVFNVPNRADLSKSDLKRIVSAIQKFGKGQKCRT